jgi:large subunit ribosomal protein L29
MRELTHEELQHHHDTLIGELANLRVRLATKQLDNPVKVRFLRHEIARAKTVLAEKTRGAKPGEKPQETAREKADA